MKTVSDYLKGYYGKDLLAKHKLDEVGIWEVRGEDPNCDFGGHHHQPFIGHYEGTLKDILELAVTLPGFWQWGEGGQITKVKPTKVVNPVKTQTICETRLANLIRAELKRFHKWTDKQLCNMTIEYEDGAAICKSFARNEQ